MKLFLQLLLISIFISYAHSHPVIWKDGVVATTKFTDTMSDYRSHYSFTHKWAAGIHNLRVGQRNYSMLQNNYLFNRWNQPGSQGNLYFFSGLGSKIGSSDKIGHFGIQADWETRLLYTQLSYDGYFTNDSFHKINARFGISPYLAEYTYLHSWIILQLDSNLNSVSTTTTLMPVLRLFKDNYLVEFGSNFSSTYLVTLMLHI